MRTHTNWTLNSFFSSYKKPWWWVGGESRSRKQRLLIFGSSNTLTTAVNNHSLILVALSRHSFCIGNIWWFSIIPPSIYAFSTLTSFFCLFVFPLRCLLPISDTDFSATTHQIQCLVWSHHNHKIIESQSILGWKGFRQSHPLVWGSQPS